jgi:hypothetical protein
MTTTAPAEVTSTGPAMPSGQDDRVVGLASNGFHVLLPNTASIHAGEHQREGQVPRQPNLVVGSLDRDDQRLCERVTLTWTTLKEKPFETRAICIDAFAVTTKRAESRRAGPSEHECEVCRQLRVQKRIGFLGDHGGSFGQGSLTASELGHAHSNDVLSVQRAQNDFGGKRHQFNEGILHVIPKARRPDSFSLRESSDSFGMRRFAPCRQP